MKEVFGHNKMMSQTQSNWGNAGFGRNIKAFGMINNSSKEYAEQSHDDISMISKLETAPKNLP